MKPQTQPSNSSPSNPSEKYTGASEKSNVPRYRVAQPIDRDGGERTIWQNVGVAFPNPGKPGGKPSISVRLDSLPLFGKVVLLAETDAVPSPPTHNRYRVVAPIEGAAGETRWTRIGTAFVNIKEEAAPSITCRLESLPLGNEFVLFPDEPKDERGGDDK